MRQLLSKIWDPIILILLGASVLIANKLHVIPNEQIPYWTLFVLMAFFIHIIIDRYQAEKVDKHIVKLVSDHSTEVKTIISASLANDFQTPQEDLMPFREIWHHYHVTIINKQPCWRYVLIDFKHCDTAVGFLSSRVSFVNKEKNRVWYNVKVGLRTDRLICFLIPERGVEPSWIEIYPKRICKRIWGQARVLFPANEEEPNLWLSWISWSVDHI